MNIIPFEPEHVARIKLQERQRGLRVFSPEQYLQDLQSSGPAVTAMVAGEVICCGGIAIAAKDEGRGALWGYVGRDVIKHMVVLDRCVRRLIDVPKLRRLESTTPVDFPPGYRWLELLGFQYELTLRKYGEDGVDHMLYARIQ
jgi:hypothetical protein